MDGKTIIPSAAAPDREGLELSVRRLDGAVAGHRLLLGVGQGAAILEMGPQEGHFVFGWGKARVGSTGPQAGRAFVDAVADWLGLELREAASSEAAAIPPGEIGGRWVRLGSGEGPLATRWDSYKLFFDLGDLHAEVFLRLSAAGDRAQLVEKWSRYRHDLACILERALSESSPRVVGPRQGPVTGPNGELLFSVHRAFELAIPDQWLLSRQPEGHWRLADREDEMMIEVSCLFLPPLAPGAPDVPARLRFLIEESEHAATATEIATFERGGAAFAWAEYSFDSSDDKRPEASPRPARGRWLIASNAWVQALVTGCWWLADSAIATAAWDGVVASLRLAGRVTTEQPRADDVAS